MNMENLEGVNNTGINSEIGKLEVFLEQGQSQAMEFPDKLLREQERSFFAITEMQNNSLIDVLARLGHVEDDPEFQKMKLDKEQEFKELNEEGDLTIKQAKEQISDIVKEPDDANDEIPGSPHENVSNQTDESSKLSRNLEGISETSDTRVAEAASKISQNEDPTIPPTFPRMSESEFQRRAKLAIDSEKQKVEPITPTESAEEATTRLRTKLRSQFPDAYLPGLRENTTEQGTDSSSEKHEAPAKIVPKIEKNWKQQQEERRQVETPEGKFEQRNKSLEIQDMITDGRSPEEVSRSIETLSEHDSNTRRMRGVSEKYRAAYDTVHKYQEGNLPPAELFKRIFGISPRGSLSVDYGPTDISFILDDKVDYARAVYGTEDPDANMLKEGQYHGGCAITGGNMSRELNGRVILVQKENEQLIKNELGDVLAHERQHSQNNLYEDTRFHDGQKVVTIEKIQSSPKESQKEAIMGYLRYERQSIDNGNIHDELIAHYKGLDLKSKDEIGKKVVANLVISYRERFYSTRSRMCRERLEKAGINSSVADECIHESFTNESWKVIRDGANCLKDLEDAGLTKDQSINLIQMEPLARWPEVARQFIEQKKKNT